MNADVHHIDGFAQAVVQKAVFVQQVLFALIFEQVLNFGNVDFLVLLVFVFMHGTETDFEVLFFQRGVNVVLKPLQS